MVLDIAAMDYPNTPNSPIPHGSPAQSSLSDYNKLESDKEHSDLESPSIDPETIPNNLCRQNSYSCESVYMQCYDAAEDSDSMTNYSHRTDTDPKMSTLNTGFEYYRPTKGAAVSMGKFTDNEVHTSSFDQVYGTERTRTSLSPSMQMRAQQAMADSDLRLSRESRMSQVSATMDIHDDAESEGCNPEYFIDSLDLVDRERSSSLTTVVHPLAEPKYHACYQGFPAISSPHDSRGHETELKEGNNGGLEAAEDDGVDGDGTSDWTWFTSTPEVDVPVKSQHVPADGNLAYDPQEKQQQSTQPASGLQNDHPEAVTSKTNGSESKQSGKGPSGSQFTNEDELGLDSLKTSKAEQLDELYTDRNNDNEENRCLWILFKVFTWTTLVVLAAFVLICGKLSAVVLSQSIVAPANVSELIEKLQTSDSNSTYVTPLNSVGNSASQTSMCQLHHFKRLSLEPSLSDTYVYSQSKNVYFDKTMIIMWLFLLLLSPVLGVITGLYAYVRWQNVRRASLSWKSVFVTVLASLVEAVGISLFLFEVLPYLDPSWSLLLPALVMVIPSGVRLYQRTKGHSKVKKAIGWTLLISLNVTTVFLICLIIAGVFFGEEPNMRLFWTLPSSVILMSLAWMPVVLTWQVEGTYTTTDIENLGGELNMEKLEDRKRSGLRAKHKLWCSFCKCIWYPLAVFSVFVLFDGYEMLLQLQNHFIPACRKHILHHPMVPYFVLNIAATIFSPLTVWVVFTAAIEFQVSLKRCIRRPVSGTFFVLLITVIMTMCLAATNVPCLVVGSASCCQNVGVWKIPVVVSLSLLLFLGNLPVIYNVMIANHAIFIPIDKVFTLATGTSVLMDPWVWLNITSSSLHQRARIADFRAQRERSKIYICTTMYREDEKEMLELLKSIKRINDSRGPSKPLCEAHVFFDGALSLGSDGKTRFNGFALQLIALVEKTFDIQLEQFGQRSTPYGIQWEVPLWTDCVKKPMTLYIHLKDNSKVKKKKRWSQIMYMVWALEHEAEVPVEDRYVLITDGDTKFYEKGPVALLDALLISPEAAAVVGRVRPVITSSPLVWYQVFEYAASFWLYKASNDQLGTDLCCSGCFTMYRGSMLKEVIKDYATEANNARDFLMIDMGEDLWLSTLLIRSGYKLKYSSVADVYTQAPCRLEEYYKQRRRWYLSSLAYFFFFIGQLRRFKFGNPHVTLPYLFYQGVLLFFPLISTSTLGVVLAVAQSYAFRIPLMWSAALVAAIFVIQHLVCLCFPSHIQIKASAVLSVLPSLSTIGIVVVVLMNSCQDYIDAFTPVNGTTLASTRVALMEAPVPLPTLMLTTLVGLVLLTGLLHPKEFYYIFYVVFYIIGNPLGYIFLRAYMLCNVTDQSWGTRETTKSSTSDAGSSQSGTLRACCTAACCCRTKQGADSVPDIIMGTGPGELRDSGIDSGNTSQAFGSDQLSSVQTSMSSLELESQRTIQDKQEEAKSESLVIEMVDMQLSDAVKERMLALRTELELRTQAYTTASDKEDRFWERLIELKLSNVETEAHRRSHLQVQEGLRGFQRRMLVVYFVVNALWVCLLTLFWVFFGDWINMSSWGRHFDIVVVIAIPYLLVNMVQFGAMFVHRMGIWLYLLARRKCRLGDVIMCGYPTNQSADLGPDVTRPAANEDRRYIQSRDVSAPPVTDVTSPYHVNQATSSPGGPRPSRWSDPLMLNPAHPGWSPFASPLLATRAQHPSLSRFQDSRWLLGTSDHGMLTHEDAARGMVLSASQESLNALMAARGSGGGQPIGGSTQYLPHTLPHPHTLPFHLPRATPPSAKRYRVQGDTLNTRSSGSPLFRRAANQKLRRFDLRDDPEDFMHHLAARTAKLQRLSH